MVEQEVHHKEESAAEESSTGFKHPIDYAADLIVETAKNAKDNQQEEASEVTEFADDTE